MNKVQKSSKNLPQNPLDGNLQQEAGWLLSIINAIGRWLRPTRRKRSISYKTKELTRDRYLEKEIVIKDEY